MFILDRTYIFVWWRIHYLQYIWILPLSVQIIPPGFRWLSFELLRCSRLNQEGSGLLSDKKKSCCLLSPACHLLLLDTCICFPKGAEHPLACENSHPHARPWLHQQWFFPHFLSLTMPCLSQTLSVIAYLVEYKHSRLNTNFSCLGSAGTMWHFISLGFS